MQFAYNTRRYHMSFYVLGEPRYKNNTWYKHILDGFVNEKRKKRFSLTILNNIDELNQSIIYDDDVIFLIGTNRKWLASNIPICEKSFANRVIVIGNHLNRLPDYKYSVVTSDISHDVQLHYNYLVSYGKTRIAMYGINPSSVSDTLRKENFLSCGAKEDDVFYNRDSLSQCYDDFLQRIDEYDAVICANDYASISLFKHLKEEKDIFISCCDSNTQLLPFFSADITHTSINYNAYIKSAFDLSYILQKNKHVNSIHLYLSSNFSVGKSTNALPLLDKSASEKSLVQDEKHQDVPNEVVNEMFRVETLLNSCDKNDLQIIECLLSNMTYTEISDKMFISLNGLKYRLKHMFQACQVTSKTELLELLKKYLSNNFKN